MRLSNGNKKIGKDTFILNMTSATDCPAKRRGLCAITGICYAMKAERQYPACLPFRRAQDMMFHAITANEIANSIITRAAGKRVKIKYLRFSESGDFKNQRDVNKMSKIAELLEPAGIRVYGYTARRDLKFDKIHKNMIVNGSGFMVSNNSEAVPEAKPGDVVCPGNCRTCHMCKSKKGLNIKVMYH